MRAKQIVMAEKADVVYGSWRDGPVPKTAFPLGKSGKSIRFGTNYRWRSMSFRSGSTTYRVLIAVEHAKLNYYAYLGEAVERILV